MRREAADLGAYLSRNSLVTDWDIDRNCGTNCHDLWHSLASSPVFVYQSEWPVRSVV